MCVETAGDMGKPWLATLTLAATFRQMVKAKNKNHCESNLDKLKNNMNNGSIRAD